MTDNPLAELRRLNKTSQNSTILLDGGLATALESAGHNLNTPLWSADLLLHNPQAIQDVHQAYFRAGAQVAITASYQASTRGLSEYLSINEGEAEALLAKSVALAINARNSELASSSSLGEERDESLTEGRQLLVAGSVGPYGAYLADGSEYTGVYPLQSSKNKTTTPAHNTSIPTSTNKGNQDSNIETTTNTTSNANTSPSELDAPLSEAQIITLLKDFHRPRIRALQAAGADLFACETMPNFLEIKALTNLLTEFNTKAWLTFTLKDETHISDGTDLAKVVKYIIEHDQRPEHNGNNRRSRNNIIGIGLNCVPLSLVSGALRTITETLNEATKNNDQRSGIEIIVYPNSGEKWNGVEKKWEEGEMRPQDLQSLVREWVRLGATVIGGCCRMGVAEIESMKVACER